MNLQPDVITDATTDPGTLPAPAETSSLRASIELDLEHMILTGELLPGQRLNELQLSAKFGISRGPLREAMRGLNAKGLVETIRNRGVFVRAVLAAEALEIYDVRAAIFGLAGRILADRVDDAMLNRMHEFLDEMDLVARQQSFDEYYRLNLAFHDFLIQSTGNKTLVSDYKALVKKLHLCRARSLVQAGGLAVSNREHRDMIDAVSTGDKERAQSAFFRHVERSKQRFATTIDAGL